MPEPPKDDLEAPGRKKLVLVLAAIALVLLVIAIIWWSNLADSDVERGPVDPIEGITDSADDQR